MFEQKFMEFDRDGSGYLDFEEFKQMFDSLRQHKEIRELFDRYKDENSEFITFIGMRKFMQIEQGENLSNEESAKLINQIVTGEKNGEVDLYARIS